MSIREEASKIHSEETKKGAKSAFFGITKIKLICNS